MALHRLEHDGAVARRGRAIATKRASVRAERARIVRTMRRLIEIDERELAAARAELGTSSVEDTVRAALREVAAIGARLRELEHARDAGAEPSAN